MPKTISKITQPEHPSNGTNGLLSYVHMFEVSPSNVLLWRCKACSKEVSNRWHHFHSHTPQRSYCPYCPATYSRIDTLRSHMRAKHTMYFNKHAI
ncbi:hypothetical protein HUJ04_006870 [Dendroctonus ponderosae]|nr:hypothetical protein HUJ04_006870 [Dendroctonus ponderosae]